MRQREGRRREVREEELERREEGNDILKSKLKFKTRFFFAAVFYYRYYRSKILGMGFTIFFFRFCICSILSLYIHS